MNLAEAMFIGWAILTAYFMGKVLACLESIAKSLQGRGGGE